jgi:hypothetical protein
VWVQLGDLYGKGAVHGGPAGRKAGSGPVAPGGRGLGTPQPQLVTNEHTVAHQLTHYCLV